MMMIYIGSGIAAVVLLVVIMVGPVHVVRERKKEESREYPLRHD